MHMKTALPMKCLKGHDMEVTGYDKGEYCDGWRCDWCRAEKKGCRWICHVCRVDKCLRCEKPTPVPVKTQGSVRKRPPAGAPKVPHPVPSKDRHPSPSYRITVNTDHPQYSRGRSRSDKRKPSPENWEKSDDSWLTADPSGLLTPALPITIGQPVGIPNYAYGTQQSMSHTVPYGMNPLQHVFPQPQPTGKMHTAGVSPQRPY
eukprot:TRINITY_DN23308_c0_g1_i2.p2 TRINITY_DN23308_c0_g1~~TRINITY_DN23308_c0_g1_i2.p2  ORF type:complete len:203 (+),score=39.06 TRINITY_DN23308_c0_g1_i2:248-856(+)